MPFFIIERIDEIETWLLEKPDEKRVTAEATIPSPILTQNLRVTPEALNSHSKVANVGAFISGANNNGAHSPNGITAMFIATGQDAANTAKAFNDALPLTGIILTKADGDSRGGAALSIRHITGKPIKFLGVGEKVDALEPFHPDRLASRILGMGDVLSLVEQVTRQVDHDKAEKLAKKVAKGQGFTLSDFKEQMEQMSKMGGLTSMLDKLPGMNKVPDAVKNQVNDKEIGRTIAIINSMTPQEREFPAIIKGSRKKRIAAGSGVQVQEVNKLLKQFAQMQKMMKKMKGKGMMNMMRGMKGGFPPGGMPPGGGGMPPGGGFPFK